MIGDDFRRCAYDMTQNWRWVEWASDLYWRTNTEDWDYP